MFIAMRLLDPGFWHGMWDLFTKCRCMLLDGARVGLGAAMPQLLRVQYHTVLLQYYSVCW